MNIRNKVICGDCSLELKKFSSESIDLVYLDPPFFANRIFDVEREDGKNVSFDDTWNSNIRNYMKFMANVLVECHRVLKRRGSLFLHCDWHASHYLKVELDNIFGYSNFHNEIIWRRHNAHNDTKQGCKLFGRVHDNILFYSKSKEYTWNPIYEPYPEEFILRYYNHIEPKTGRRYALGDLSGPGGRSKGNPKYRFLGVERYWRYEKSKMRKLYEDGYIIQTKRGNVPVLKRYLDEMQGLMLQDVWGDIKSVQTTKSQSVNFPTQKPTKLLERIIEISTNEKDIVLDPMCGSGTTLVAARNLNRTFIGIEKNSESCRITRNRLSARAKQRDPNYLTLKNKRAFDKLLTVSTLAS